MVLEQQSQLNAPDPRETHPPCYADAILMPKPQASFASLKDFASSESLNSNRRAAKRCNSEGHLSGEGSSKSRRLILAARSRKNQLQKLISIKGESTARKASISLINNSIRESESGQKKFEIINQLETEDGHSPYAKRRPNIETLEQKDSSIESLHEPIYANEAAIAEYKHYEHYRTLSANDSEMPQSSQSLYASNDTSYSSSFTSSTSSFDTDDDDCYITDRQSHFQNRSCSKIESDV